MSSLLADARLNLKRGESVAGPCSFSASQSKNDFPVLAGGQIHEWHLADAMDKGGLWFAPLTLLTMLADSLQGSGRILWVGRRCWPTFQILCSLSADKTPQQILSRSTFLDPLTDRERFWAIAEVLRCPGVGCVVADAGGILNTISRRIQLAAESGRAVGLLARPAWEISEPFSSATRWRVQALDLRSDEPQWSVELLRCRGLRQDEPRRWIVGWNYRVYVGTGALHFSADLGCGSVPSQNREPGRIKTA